MALSLGKKNVNDGRVAGAGITLRFNMTTTANTKMDIPATKRKMNLSVINTIKNALTFRAI